MIKIMQELEETQEEKGVMDPLWHEFIYSLFLSLIDKVIIILIFLILNICEEKFAYFSNHFEDKNEI